MIVSGRTIVFKPTFIETLDEILTYLAGYSPRYVQQFTQDLDDLIKNRIAHFPEASPEYKWKRTPQRLYRRAIFKKHYHVIYKIHPQTIEFVVILYSRRDLSKIEVE